jgi:predicted dehydrogenase
MVDLQVYCEHGSVDMNVISGVIHIHRRDGAAETSQVPDEERYPRFATAQNLVDVVLGRAANGSPVEAGWRTVELLDAAYQSAAKSGEAVFIEQLYLYTAVELRTGVFAGEETPVLNQSEV